MPHSIDPGYCIGLLRSSRSVWLAILFALPLQGLQAVEGDTGPESGERRSDAVLGMFEDFGRWDSPLQIVYDPDDAPDQFADTGHFLEILQETFHEWEVVSGVRAHVLDPDSEITDDVGLAPRFRDGLVRVFWAPAEDVAGRAGPQSANHDYDLGYRPYHDGDIMLSNTPGTFVDEGALRKVLLHETGHLLGLGHSDNPDSVMYANPYNRLPHPREDDIRAVQTLYGPPDIPVDISLPLPAWTFVAPPQAPAARTMRLFRPGEGLPSGPAFSLQSGGGANASVGELVTTIEDDTAVPTIVRFNLGMIDNSDGEDAIDIDIRWVVTDPSGYVYRENRSTLICQAGLVCGNNWLNLINARVIKAIPGEWRVTIVDESTAPEFPATLIGMSLHVDTTFILNSPPVARISMEPGANASTVVARLRVEDFDSSRIQVKWYVPGRYDLDHDGINDTYILDDMGSGEELTRSFAFALGGTGLHTLFVALSDGEARYSDDEDRLNYDVAGRGFQTLIRIDVTMPYLPGDEVRVSSTQSSKVPEESAMLAWIAGDTMLDGVIAWGGNESSRARLFASASRNGGASDESLFRTGDNVAIAGRIEPEDADVGKSAEIYVVLYDAANRFYYRDLDGIFKPWNARMTDLEPAYAIAALSTGEPFRIYEGILAAGINRVFIGYRLVAGGPMHLNSTALRVHAQ